MTKIIDRFIIVMVFIAVAGVTIAILLSARFRLSPSHVETIAAAAPFNPATDHTFRDKKMFQVGVLLGVSAYQRHEFTNDGGKKFADEMMSFCWNVWTNDQANEALLNSPLLP